MAEQKQDEELRLWYAKYLANFNGGLAYWELPDHRRETYLLIANEMIAKARPILLAEGYANGCAATTKAFSGTAKQEYERGLAEGAEKERGKLLKRVEEFHLLCGRQDMNELRAWQAIKAEKGMEK